ncbi:hypothetical protein FGO68_gene16980 [Halteria grandinella]|uniref:Uncharacterized protein n=1 Tax=Halteria grandinella TaxID=5974 RepID=A0A8J8T2R5_HALGN|nr:hypothetical protein FGO68_gene16980 [Halteria grandinella]
MFCTFSSKYKLNYRNIPDWSNKMQSTTANNIFQEKQEQCTCGKNKVRYYCIEKGCKDHQENIFFCDSCFNVLMDREEGHKQKDISTLKIPLQESWMTLFQNEGKIYTEVDAAYRKQKDIIEHLERHDPCNTLGFKGRLIARDKKMLDEFNTEFQVHKAKMQELIANEQTSQLYAYNNLRDQLNARIDRDFQYLTKIGADNYIYKNYYQCIENCSLPKDQYVRETVLQMKLKLANERIEEASNKPQALQNPQDFAEELSTVKHLVLKHEAQLRAYSSIFGNFKGACNIANVCSDFDQVEKLKIQCQGLLVEMNELKKYSDHAIRELESFKPTKPNKGVPPQQQQLLQFQLPDLSMVHSSNAQGASLIEVINPIFSQQVLDAEFGKPELKEIMQQFEWKWSAQQLNQYAVTSRQVQLTQFEGAQRDTQKKLLKGVYYGQMLNEKRDGHGIVCCTDDSNKPFLLECDWKQGVPTNKGRYIEYANGQWKFYEGTVDSIFRQ